MSKFKDSETRLRSRGKKRKLRKRVTFILLPLILIFLGVAVYAGSLYIKANSVANKAFEDDGREKSSLRDKLVDPKFDNVSILVMGIDSSEKRSGDGDARTDSLMLATLNKEKKSVKLLSIPRDSYTYIPDVGYSTKINHAHAFGGTKGTIETVENLLDVPVDYYVKVNFDAFIDVVESLDGVTVDVPFEFKEQDSRDKANAIHLKKGKQKLNGEEALALARTRKIDNDIERGKRQQMILEAMLDRAISLNSVLKYDDIIEAVGENMTTNLTFSDIKSLIAYGTNGKPDIESLSLKGRDYQPSGTYYWQLEEEGLVDVKHKLQKHLDLPLKNNDTQIETYRENPKVPGQQEGEQDLNEGQQDPNQQQEDPYQQPAQNNQYQEQQDPYQQQQDPNQQQQYNQ